jgi:hypothetical protein
MAVKQREGLGTQQQIAREITRSGAKGYFYFRGRFACFRGKIFS